MKSNDEASVGSAAKKREKYLEKCADILCEAAYRMCRENFGKGKAKDKTDPKLLKETCTAVKEAAAVTSGLSKKDTAQGEEIRIYFEGPEEYAQ